MTFERSQLAPIVASSLPAASPTWLVLDVDPPAARPDRLGEQLKSD